MVEKIVINVIDSYISIFQGIHNFSTLKTVHHWILNTQIDIEFRKPSVFDSSVWYTHHTIAW